MSERDQDLLSRHDALVRQRLARLPEIAPPERTRTFTLAAMREAAIERSSPWSRSHLAVAATVGTIVLGAAALLGAMLFAGYSWVDRASTSTVIARSAPIAGVPRSGETLPEPARAVAYENLIQASWQLEQILGELPAQRRVMSAGTASTIAELENQIAYIDEHLTLAAAGGVEPRIQQALWEERVDAMNALVQIRYAQSRLFTY